MQPRYGQLLCLIALFAGATGCAQLGGLGKKKTPLQAPAPMQVESHLLEMRMLGYGTYQEKLDLFEQIQADYYADPSDSNRLRYALAKGVSGHDFANASSAFSELRVLLDEPNTLEDAQLNLARVAVRAIENTMILEAESERLRAEVTSLQRTNVRSTRTVRRLDEIRRRLEAAEVDNEILRGELELTRQQLDAVMSIETSSDRSK